MSWLQLWKDKKMTHTVLMIFLGFVFGNTLIEVLHYGSGFILMNILMGIIYSVLFCVIFIIIFTILWCIIKNMDNYKS